MSKFISEVYHLNGVSWPSGLVHRNSSSGVVRMWVRIPAWPVVALVSLSKTLNRNCFVIRMRRKSVRPVCCVMHVKEPRTLEREREREGGFPYFWIRALSTQQGGYVRATNLQ